jgi:hypothetical protein
VVGMETTGTTAVVTEANRGLGRALVDALLERGAKRIYAGARDPRTVRGAERITPVALDVTGPDADPDGLAREFAVNFTGRYDMIPAFTPVLVANEGTLVNVLSLLAYPPAPPMAGYSASTGRCMRRGVDLLYAPPTSTRTVGGRSGRREELDFADIWKVPRQDRDRVVCRRGNRGRGRNRSRPHRHLRAAFHHSPPDP